MLEFFSSIHPALAFLLFFIENLLIVLGVVVIGKSLQGAGQKNSLFELSAKEIGVALASLTFNTLVTFAGLILYENGIIKFKTGFDVYVLIDFLILFFTMDLLMYILHFVIHKLPVYKMIHSLHHQYTNPKPIDLFVLSPLEVISFGGLWLTLIFVYGPNFYASMIYLVVNVLFGMIGHLSYEPFPSWWTKTPAINLVSTSTFHWQHHQNIHVNFGFYTLVWDRIFGTLAKDYEEKFVELKKKSPESVSV
jgi:Delta7-sterol 5-desaturase